MLSRSASRVSPGVHLGSSTGGKIVTTVEGASFLKVDTVVWLLTWIWMLYFFGLAVVICRLHVRRLFWRIQSCKEKDLMAQQVWMRLTYALHVHAEIRCFVNGPRLGWEVCKLLLRDAFNEFFKSFTGFSHCGAK